VTWATSVPILVILGLPVLDLGPMYATERQTDVRQHHRLMAPPRGGGGWGITTLATSILKHRVVLSFIVLFYLVEMLCPYVGPRSKSVNFPIRFVSFIAVKRFALYQVQLIDNLYSPA